MEHTSRIFCIKLAETVIQIEPLYSYMQEYCKEYIVEGEPEFVIRTEPLDIVYEQERSEREAAVEGRVPIRYQEDYLETLSVYRKIATQLLKKGVLLFHGSVIAVDGEGYLFTAKSGTGKSTHTSLWRQLFGERAVMINDDKPLLKITEQGVIVYGTPWSGKHNLNINKSVPLKAVCVLNRADENHIRRVKPREVYGILLQQVYRPANSSAMQQTLMLVDRLMEFTKFYCLGCNMDPSAAQVAYEGMMGVE